MEDDFKSASQMLVLEIGRSKSSASRQAFTRPPAAPDVRGGGHLRQAGHGYDVATDDDNRSRHRREPQFVHLTRNPRGTTAPIRDHLKATWPSSPRRPAISRNVFVEQFDATLRGAVKVHTVSSGKCCVASVSIFFSMGAASGYRKRMDLPFVFLDAAQHGFSQTGVCRRCLVKMSGQRRLRRPIERQNLIIRAWSAGCHPENG